MSESHRPAIAPALAAAASALASSLWIATGAAAPEFIWRGLQIAASHVRWTDVLAALLIGLILAFFVEPVMERLRALLHGPAHHRATDAAPRNALFTVGVSIAFALTSVCLHDAVAVFVAERGAEHTTDVARLSAAVTLAAAWAAVPFLITLAWLGARHRWLAVPLGVLGASSSFLAGYGFAWGWASTLTTAIPCLAILGLGYRTLAREWGRDALARCALMVAVVGTLFPAAALLASVMVHARLPPPDAFYTVTDFWVDLRFYYGWAVALTLAPFPFSGAGALQASAGAAVAD